MQTTGLPLAEAFISRHPDAAAREVETLAPDKALALLRHLPLAQVKSILGHMLPSYASRLCVRMPIAELANYLHGFNTRQIAAILRGLPDSAREDLYRSFPERTVYLCRLLLSYPKEVIGAWMRADIEVLPETLSVAEALHRLHHTGDYVDANCIPVVGARRNLLGRVSLNQLLRISGEEPLRSLVKNDIAVLPSRMTLLTAHNHSAWTHGDIAFVHNRQKQFIGLIHHAELRRGLSARIDQEPAAAPENALDLIGRSYLKSILAMSEVLRSEPSGMEPSGNAGGQS